MITCKHCNEPLTSSRNGLSCKTCKNGLDRYGLNKLQQKQLLESQNNACAICEEDVKLHVGNNFNGVIDHNHETGKVRGVLCGHCNVALGKLESNGKLDKFIENASDYLT